MTTESAKHIYSREAVRILEPYRVRFEREMKRGFDRFGPHNMVRKAMEYAMQGDAKRFRPALVYMIADALGKDADVSGCSLAVEYFHTGSLIADDLPCMDDDDIRRGKPTTHKVYGEATALLASYGLIALGYEEIAHNAAFIPDDRGGILQTAIFEASKQMGNMGLLCGQSLDLHPEGLERDDILKIMEMKTVSLFDLSLTLGWLFGGGERSKLDLVHSLSLDFGLAFQIIDDLDDQEKDRQANRAVNYANLFGVEASVDEVRRRLASFFECLKQLQLSCEPLEKLAQGLLLVSSSFSR